MNGNSQVIDLNASGALTIGIGATLTDLTNTGGSGPLLIQSTSGTAGIVTNQGTWTRNGSGTSVVSVAFNNSGTALNPAQVELHEQDTSARGR